MSRKALGLIITLLAIAALVGVAVIAMMDNDDATPEPSTTATSDQSVDTSASQSDETPSNAETTPPSENQNEDVQIEIENFAFSPGSVTVKKGTKVTWTNNDSVGHTVTKSGAAGPDSSLLSKGQSYSFTFDTVGTFDYFCGPHPQMTAKVIVTE